MIYSNILIFLECGNWAANNLNAYPKHPDYCQRPRNTQGSSPPLQSFSSSLLISKTHQALSIFFLIVCLCLSHSFAYLFVFGSQFCCGFSCVVCGFLFTFLKNHYFPYLQLSPFSVHLEQNCWIHLPIGM